MRRGFEQRLPCRIGFGGGVGVFGGAGDRLAGALCFSGMPRARSALPTHALLGANDPLVPARSAKSPRPSLELEVLEGYGHTLGVGPSLPGPLLQLRERSVLEGGAVGRRLQHGPRLGAGRFPRG